MRRVDIVLYLSFFAVIALGCAYFGSIAYSRAGQIVSNADATALYNATATPDSSDLEELAEYQVGDEIEIEGGDYGALVPLYAQPGARFFSSQIIQSSPVTVLALGIDGEGIIWYQVQGLAGTGWIRAENLRPRTPTPTPAP